MNNNTKFLGEFEINNVYQVNCLDALKKIPDGTIDSIVTDPPYELGLMNKKWDTTGIAYDINLWKECLRVLKNGGHLLSFGGTRTYHRMACAIEDSGFEIRDMIEWLYFNGFLKGQNVGKMFDKRAGVERKVIGYKVEPDGRKMWDEPESDNRICNPDKDDRKFGVDSRKLKDRKLLTEPATELGYIWDGWNTHLRPAHEPIVLARKPLIGTVCENIEIYNVAALNHKDCKVPTDNDIGRLPSNCVTLEDEQFYSTYFNISPKELSKKANKKDKGEHNTHPSVKPTELMSWLIKLVTPENGIVLDPFAGSGSTLVSAKRNNFSFIGFELEEEYITIIRERLKNI